MCCPQEHVTALGAHIQGNCVQNSRLLASVTTYTKPATSGNSSNELTFRPGRGASVDHMDLNLRAQASTTSTGSVSSRGCNLRRSVSSGASGNGMKGRLSSLNVSCATRALERMQADVDGSDSSLVTAGNDCSTPSRRNIGMISPLFVHQGVSSNEGPLKLHRYSLDSRIRTGAGPSLHAVLKSVATVGVNLLIRNLDCPKWKWWFILVRNTES
jgi:hypothetical protein